MELCFQNSVLHSVSVLASFVQFLYQYLVVNIYKVRDFRLYYYIFKFCTSR